MKKILYKTFACIFLIYFLFVLYLEINSIIQINASGDIDYKDNNQQNQNDSSGELINLPQTNISGENDIPNNDLEDIFISNVPDSSGDVENQKCVWQIQNNDNSVFSQNIFIANPEKYNLVEGITTFRGNNFRDSAFYGSLNVTEKKLVKTWTRTNGQTDGWTGVGWNGQPAIIKWDETLKTQMNLYDEFKNKKDFVEVIYGTLDSHIHFYDLETGASTRPSIQVPSSIKGSVTIDPRGYPLLYVGQGINEVSGEAVEYGYRIFSLIDGKELFFINGRDKFAYIGWGAFDGNPLIDTENDTLILPGENGIIYIVKLNTKYDILGR